MLGLLIIDVDIYNYNLLIIDVDIYIYNYNKVEF